MERAGGFGGTSSRSRRGRGRGEIALPKETLLSAYSDGVTVICELAAQFTDVMWLAATPCPEWRAVDLAGHLRCVADDYHEYLDDAPASRLARLMATNASADSLARKLARQNAAELAALPDAPGPEHIAAFAESARAYGRRLPACWDLPHHSYRGVPATVAAMAGAACAEWHLHAWDLARSLGKDYRPADPELVLDAWQGGMPQLWPEDTIPPDDDDPWLALLRASGRDPHWSQVLEWSAVYSECNHFATEGYSWAWRSHPACQRRLVLSTRVRPAVTCPAWARPPSACARRAG